MKMKLIFLCCMFAASAADGWAKPIDDAEPMPGQSRLRDLSAAPGESRTFRIDLPAEAEQLRVQTSGGVGPLGVHVRSPSSSRECSSPPSVERGLVCILGWSPGNEPRSYLVTLTAGDNHGYENVDLRVHHEPLVLRNGVTWDDIDPTMLGSVGFRFGLEKPGPLSLRTMGGHGNTSMTLIHDDGSFGGKRVCESQAGGTSHRCDLPAAPVGSYRVVLGGDFGNLSMLATWP